MLNANSLSLSKKELVPSDALPANISLFFLCWHTLCSSLKCCNKRTVCCEDCLKSLPYCFFFCHRHITLQVPVPFSSASLSSPLLSSLLFLPHAPLHFPHSAFQFSPPLLALSLSLSPVFMHTCQDCVSHSPPA